MNWVKPACLGDDHRPKQGNKAQLYCGQCARNRCLFRPTLSPVEYRHFQLVKRGLVESHDEPVERLSPTEVRPLILQVLAQGEMTVAQLEKRVRLSHSHLWAHLDAMRKCGLVASHGTGRGRELTWRLKMIEEPKWWQEIMELAAKADAFLEPLLTYVLVACFGDEPMYEEQVAGWA